MPFVFAAPCIERTGVVAGFVLSDQGTLTPAISLGVLFAQSTMYRPNGAPSLPAADASQQSWLFYNTSAGFYWADTPEPETAGDAFIGWVVADATKFLAISNQRIAVAAAQDSVTVISLGPVVPIGGGGLDGDAPPAPVFGTQPSWLGYLEIVGLSFAELTNAHTVHTATFTLWAWDETAPVRTSLSSGISDVVLSLTAVNLAGFAAGDYVVVDAEILKLGTIAGNTAAIERAQLGSTAAAHASAAKAIRLARTMATATFAPDFFGSPASGEWSLKVIARDLRVAAIECFVTNAIGNSPVTTVCLTASTDYGLRVLAGGQVDITVEGVLGIQSAAAPEAHVPQTSSVRDIWARLRIAPTGADVVVDVKVAGTVVATLTIADGETEASISGRDLDAIPEEDAITIDVTGVGTTFPGQDLVVNIRL